LLPRAPKKHAPTTIKGGIILVSRPRVNHTTHFYIDLAAARQHAIMML